MAPNIWSINFFSLLFLAESKPKELPPLMPVMMIKAITQDKKSTLICYECPIYKTRQRGPTYVWTFELKTKGSPSKWVLAGVALLLQNWLLTMLFKLYSSIHLSKYTKYLNYLIILRPLHLHFNLHKQIIEVFSKHFHTSANWKIPLHDMP